jgi:HSP20 family protein
MKNLSIRRCKKMAEREEQKKQRNQQGETRNKQQSSQTMEPARRASGSQRGLSRRGAFAPSVWGGGRSLSSFSNEIDQLFEDFLDFAGFGRTLPKQFGSGGLAPRGFNEVTQSLWSPEIEVFERGGQLVVRADLPGLNRDDVKVDIRHDALIIQGERRQEHEENEEGFYRSERSYGSFYRSIPLPEGVEDEDIKASFRDGVLEVTMPVPQGQQRSRRIEIGEGTTGEEKPRSKAQASGKS